MSAQPGRYAEQFNLRLPDGMRDRIAEEARANGRSMNAEIVARLEASLSGGEAVNETLVRRIADEASRATVREIVSTFEPTSFAAEDFDVKRMRILRRLAAVGFENRAEPSPAQKGEVSTNTERLSETAAELVKLGQTDPTSAEERAKIVESLDHTLAGIERVAESLRREHKKRR